MRKVLVFALLTALAAAVLVPATSPVVKEEIQDWLRGLEASGTSALFLSPYELVTSTSTDQLSIDFQKLESVPRRQGWPNKWPMPGEAREFLGENFPELVRALAEKGKEVWFIGARWGEVVKISEATGMETGKVVELLQVFAELLTRAFPNRVVLIGHPLLEGMAAYSGFFSVQDGQRIDQIVQTLNNGTIPEALRDAFSANNRTLSSQASVEVVTPNAEWRITDQGREFIIRLEDGALNIYYGLVWRRVQRIVVVDGLPRDPESLQRLFPHYVARFRNLEEAWDRWQRKVLDRLEELLTPPLFKHHVVRNEAEFDRLAPLEEGESIILEVGHTSVDNQGPYIELPSEDKIRASQIDALAARAPWEALIACRREIRESYNDVLTELVRSGGRLIPTVGPGVEPDARIAVEVIEALSSSPLPSLLEEQGHFTVGDLLEHFPRQIEIEVEEGRPITYTFRLYVLPQGGEALMQAFMIASLRSDRQMERGA